MYFFEKQIITDPTAAVLIEQYAQTSDYAYAERFKRLERQKQSLIGRCLVRKMAVTYRPSTNPDDWSIRPHDDTGPSLQHKETGTSPNICISHSHEIVIASLCPDYPIGIDVEYMGKERDIYKIIEALTAKDDLIHLPQNKDQLYALWVLYESWYKLNPKKTQRPYSQCSNSSRQG